MPPKSPREEEKDAKQQQGGAAGGGPDSMEQKTGLTGDEEVTFNNQSQKPEEKKTLQPDGSTATKQPLIPLGSTPGSASNSASGGTAGVTDGDRAAVTNFINSTVQQQVEAAMTPAIQDAIKRIEANAMAMARAVADGSLGAIPKKNAGKKTKTERANATLPVGASYADATSASVKQQALGLPSDEEIAKALSQYEGASLEEVPLTTDEIRTLNRLRYKEMTGILENNERPEYYELLRRQHIIALQIMGAGYLDKLQEKEKLVDNQQEELSRRDALIKRLRTKLEKRWEEEVKQTMAAGGRAVSDAEQDDYVPIRHKKKESNATRRQAQASGFAALFEGRNSVFLRTGKRVPYPLDEDEDNEDRTDFVSPQCEKSFKLKLDSFVFTPNKKNVFASLDKIYELD